MVRRRQRIHGGREKKMKESQLSFDCVLLYRGEALVSMSQIGEKM